jgi:hypothetical protein
MNGENQPVRYSELPKECRQRMKPVDWNSYLTYINWPFNITDSSIAQEIYNQCNIPHILDGKPCAHKIGGACRVSLWRNGRLSANDSSTQ